MWQVVFIATMKTNEMQLLLHFPLALIFKVLETAGPVTVTILSEDETDGFEEESEVILKQFF